jgi:alpha-glucosidase (family GH31 glycosyl hydrolase)
LKLRTFIFAIITFLVSALVPPDLLALDSYHAQDGPVTIGQARVEFISPTMVRLQYSPRSQFVDQPTVVVEYRQPVPVPITIKQELGWVIISSASITVRYKTLTGIFNRENLAVSWNFKGDKGSWSPGDVDTCNLGGITTLDGVNGNRLPPPQKGLLSRSGYFVLDDSQSPIIDRKSEWIAPRADEGNQDWYFIAYGHDYCHALKEFSLLCGKIPMVPRYSLGIWMTDLNYEYLPGSDMTTKFHFTSNDLKQEINRFRAEGLPLDVLVLDFGWHKFGWQGGYDWSPIFDGAQSFLRWCHGSGIHITVNDHPKTQGETALSDQDSHAQEARRLLGDGSGVKPTYTFAFPENWRFSTDPTDTGMLASWYSTSLDDSSWRTLDGGKPWQEQGYPDYVGLGWYRKWVNVPENSAQHLYLIFGGSASQYALFVNGKMVGDHISAGNQTYNTMTYTDITDFVQRGKRNLIALRINAWSNYGGLTALPVEISDAVPLGLLEFTLTDKRQADAFMSALHAPPMKEGVDFWWIDGTGPCSVKGLNNQLWTNKLYYDFTEKLTGKRSLILSRYAGWGSQRYPAFHSGDTYSEWPMLAFQVGFTGRAGNMLIPYVSHDIGGFHGDTLSVGLYCRWLEFGAFAPILRLHGAYENPANGNLRMPWMYGQQGIDVAQKYFNLREQLLPYIYTYSRVAYDDGVSIVRPLYLENPEMPESYSYPGEYFFGDNFLVTPVVDSSNAATTYFPPGKWIRYSDGKEYASGQVIKEVYATDAIPLFVKAGSIIPMQSRMRYCSERPLDTLIIQAFGPDSGSFNLYEDDGLSLQYLHEQFSWTKISCSGNEQTGYCIKIGATSGTYSGQVSRRAYILQLRGFPEPHKIQVDGRMLKRGAKTGTWCRDAQTGTVEVSIPAKDIRKSVEVGWH